ncbi:MAG: thiamine pyrophosphate-dependent dehydrogenase E1 component subunit alpha [Sphingomonadaceae bacterium]
MSRIRAVDKAIQAGLSAGKFMFTYWPLTGQECIPATISQLITKDDYMVTTYRGIHDQVAKGVDLYGMFAEALGREDGVNKGKGGSPHISDPSSGSMVTTAIVGAGAPIANGLAISAKERGEDRVTIVNFGDGATSIGAVHEAMNLAGAWKLPVIFMCQNNEWGEYTPIPKYTASPNFYGRAEALGFRGVQLDGNDPVAFYNGMKDVIEHVRAGKGPVFVEAKTFRLGPHAGVGDNMNVDKDYLKTKKEQAPVDKTRALLVEAGICRGSRCHRRSGEEGSRRGDCQGDGIDRDPGERNAHRRLRRSLRRPGARQLSVPRGRGRTACRNEDDVHRRSGARRPADRLRQKSGSLHSG